MRCLSLAEGLLDNGHEVVMITNDSKVTWLEELKALSGLKMICARQHELESTIILGLNPDWVVIDSYEISSSQISRLDSIVKVLAIVDGESRGIDATLFLDHNFASESISWPETVKNQILAGSNYSLIRDSILAQKRDYPWVFQSKSPHVVAFMGGSDPTGAIKSVTQALLGFVGKAKVTIVAGPEWLPDLEQTTHHLANFDVILPTSSLPNLIGVADIVISAAGTSSWELCTLGVPSVLVAVVENQVECWQRMMDDHLVLGVDLIGKSDGDAVNLLKIQIERLLDSEDLRRKISMNSVEIFDGVGKKRVVQKMEQMQR